MFSLQPDGNPVVGVSEDLPGMGYRNPKTGEMEGFEVELARAVVRLVAGFQSKPYFIPVKPEERIAVLEFLQADMVLSQLTMTLERQKAVDFSVPYFTTREALLVARGSTIRSYDDVSGKRIAVTSSSASLQHLSETFPEAHLVVKSLDGETLDAVGQGEADGAANAHVCLTVLRKFSQHPDDFSIIDSGDRFKEKSFAIAIPKGRPDVLAALNKAVGTLKALGDIDRMAQANVG